MSERYEVETIDGVTYETRRWDYRDFNEAAKWFYQLVALNYDEETVGVQLHDLVARKTLAVFDYQVDEDNWKVVYNQ